MPFRELPMSVMFLFFLWLFLLLGFVPMWKKARAKMRRIRRERQAQGTQVAEHWSDERQETVRSSGGLLSDYETFVLRRLAQAGRSGLSRKRLQKELFMDQATFAATLESLHRRGMVGIGLTLWRGVRFQLTRRGHDYAVEQGFIPILHS